ncbi:MAG: hypothetical protein WC121_13955 [Candidatus Kapaibacterium sp.]|jgi:hypothetical protein
MRYFSIIKPDGTMESADFNDDFNDYTEDELYGYEPPWEQFLMECLDDFDSGSYDVRIYSRHETFSKSYSSDNGEPNQHAFRILGLTLADRSLFGNVLVEYKKV